jgi:hypothetical protein
MDTTMTRTSTRILLALTCVAVTLSGAPALAGDTVKCESKNNERRLCPADTSQGVVLTKQRSSEGCWKDETWGYTSEGIWVSDNCRAEFATGASQVEKKDEGGSGAKTAAIVGGIAAAAVVGTIIATNDDDDKDDNRWGWGNGDNRVVRCESRDNRRRICRVGDHDRVEMRRQLSDRPCRRGSSWGTSRDYVWVDNGCRAEFWVEK